MAQSSVCQRVLVCTLGGRIHMSTFPAVRSFRSLLPNGGSLLMREIEKKRTMTDLLPRCNGRAGASRRWSWFDANRADRRQVRQAVRQAAQDAGERTARGHSERVQTQGTQRHKRR